MNRGRAGYSMIMNDVMNDEANSENPVIDLTSGISIDEFEHPYAVAEQVISVAA